MNRTLICAESEAYRNYVPLKIAEACSALICTPTFLMLSYIAITRKKRVITSSLHFNFRLLLYNIWFVLMCQMLSDIPSCVYMVYRMAFVSDYCANTFYVWQGFLLRGPVLWAIPALTLVHAAALLERTMATRYAETYERRGKGLGIATMVFMWILGTAINYIVFAVDDVFEELPYCFVTVPKNQERIRLMLTALLPVELLITVGDIGLWWVNRRDLKTTVYKAYSLSKSFQQSENYLTSRLVMPISLAHSSFYWVFLTVTSVYRSSHGYDGEPKAFVAGVIYVNNILLIGLNVCVIVYLCCLRKMDNERRVREIEQGPRKNTEIYFKMLNTQIK